MHITAVSVVAINGNTSEGDDASQHDWTSAEDWEHFVRLRDSFDLIVLDEVMYDSVQPQPEPDRLRVVMTKQPKAYADKAVPGQLEFTDRSPEQIVRELEARGYTRLLLAGGQDNITFWNAGLVSELYLTVEPYILAEGAQFLSGGKADVRLRLLGSEQVNDRGTLVLHYAVDSAGAKP